MPTLLSNSQIKDTYGQLLHVNGGVTTTLNTVYDGDGTPTPISISTTDLQVGNVNISGNTISPATGALGLDNVAIVGGYLTGITDIAIADGGTGASTAVDARANLGLGTIATQSASNVAITGGAITGITDLAVADGGTGASTLTGYVKGNGTAAFTAAATVPFADLSGRSYGMFSDVTSQTGSVSAVTAVKFGTNEITGAGISVVTDGAALTRVTVTDAGTYLVAPNLQIANGGASDFDVTIWFAVNGTAVARSATKITVPKASDGGNAFFQLAALLTLTAGQYVQVMWVPEDATQVTLAATAAAAGPPAIPAIPSSIIIMQRIA